MSRTKTQRAGGIKKRPYVFPSMVLDLFLSLLLCLLGLGGLLRQHACVRDEHGVQWLRLPRCRRDGLGHGVDDRVADVARVGLGPGKQQGLAQHCRDHVLVRPNSHEVALLTSMVEARELPAEAGLDGHAQGCRPADNRPLLDLGLRLRQVVDHELRDNRLALCPRRVVCSLEALHDISHGVQLVLLGEVLDDVVVLAELEVTPILEVLRHAVPKRHPRPLAQSGRCHPAMLLKQTKPKGADSTIRTEVAADVAPKNKLLRRARVQTRNDILHDAQ